jgi:hypothetical protein
MPRYRVVLRSLGGYPFGPRLFTHVFLGTFCHPCVRAGQRTPWLGRQDSNLCIPRSPVNRSLDQRRLPSRDVVAYRLRSRGYDRVAFRCVSSVKQNTADLGETIFGPQLSLDPDSRNPHALNTDRNRRNLRLPFRLEIQSDVERGRTMSKPPN